MNPQTGGQLVIALKLNAKEITPSYCRARRIAAPFCTKGYCYAALCPFNQATP
ncbi:hypothetical protein AB4Z52_20240 [Rhizobium sp. 2YAF20]|uniref:hypothetical protein n=1 Tax=Rhizobium sp. 2YAF20 TaxID=3233027 RepID=UPI003F9A1BAA